MLLSVRRWCRARVDTLTADWRTPDLRQHVIKTIVGTIVSASVVAFLYYGFGIRTGAPNMATVPNVTSVRQAAEPNDSVRAARASPSAQSVTIPYSGGRGIPSRANREVFSRAEPEAPTDSTVLEIRVDSGSVAVGLGPNGDQPVGGDNLDVALVFANQSTTGAAVQSVDFGVSRDRLRDSCALSNGPLLENLHVGPGDVKTVKGIVSLKWILEQVGSLDNTYATVTVTARDNKGGKYIRHCVAVGEIQIIENPVSGLRMAIRFNWFDSSWNMLRPEFIVP